MQKMVSLILTLNEGTGPFSYNWSNVNNANAGNEDIGGLTPGIYDVTVTSKAGCVTFCFVHHYATRSAGCNP
jgi:hypothetical protein